MKKRCHGASLLREDRHLPWAAGSVLQMYQEDFTPEEYEKMIADYRADWKKYGVEVR